MTSRAEFHKGLSAWLHAKQSEYRNDPYEGSISAREAIDDLIKELDKSISFENRFPWETSLV